MPPFGAYRLVPHANSVGIFIDFVEFDRFKLDRVHWEFRDLGKKESLYYQLQRLLSKTKMAELDKREPFGSVKIDQHYSTNSAEKEKELELSMKDLDNCKMQFENKESACMKAITKLQAYDKTLAKLSIQLQHSESERNKYMDEWKKTQAFISMLESEYEVVIDQLVDSIKNNEELLQTVDELKMQLVVMQDLENENLEKTILTDYYQLELMQSKKSLNTKIEILHDESNKVSELTRQVDILNDKSFESKKRELELESEIAMLKSELHKNRSRIAAAVAAEARAMSRQSGLYLAVEELAVEAERAKKESYKSLVEKDKMKEELDVASAEISKLKSTLDEMRRRVEIAENVKSEIEERLRRWREMRKMRRVASEAHKEESNGRNIGSASLQDGKIFKSVPLSKFLDIKL